MELSDYVHIQAERFFFQRGEDGQVEKSCLNGGIF